MHDAKNYSRYLALTYLKERKAGILEVIIEQGNYPDELGENAGALVYDTYMVFWIFIAIIIAGYLIASAMKQANASTVALSHEQLKNTPEYRKKYAKIQEFNEMLQWFYTYSEMAAGNRLEIAKNPKMDERKKKHLEGLAKSNEKDAKKFRDEYWSKQEEGDPYSPSRLPMDEWPKPLRDQHDLFEELGERWRKTNEEIRLLGDLAAAKKAGSSNANIEWIQKEIDSIESFLFRA